MGKEQIRNEALLLDIAEKISTLHDLLGCFGRELKEFF
jgi:hypothetical protein